MAIEFPCGACGRLLRTPDDTAGRQAQCPHCGGLTTIPYAVGEPRFAEWFNPYQSPTATAVPPPNYAPPAGELRRTPLDFEDVLSRTWEIFKQQMGPCVVAWLLFFVLNALVNGPAYVVSNVFLEQVPDLGARLTAMLLVNLATTVYTTWLEIGLAVFMLKIARGQHAPLSDLFSGLPFFVPIFLAKLLFGICVGLGLMMCVVPGVVLALMMFQYYYLIIDRNAGIVDSLGQSIDLTWGSRLTWLAVYVVVMILGVIVMLLTCGLGLFVFGPFYSLLFAVAYLAMTGQPTADRLRFARPGASSFPEG